ncbi:MAG: hypothetical protein ACFFCE_05285 [Promethearchaeota archaeon]
MSSLESQLYEKIVMKKKVCVLGGMEYYKDEFQKELSSNTLPIENKQNIGVNISKIDFLFGENDRFEILLWNIDCRQQRAYLRTIFYNGAEAIIILISESKVDQLLSYLEEIQTRMPPITLVFCIILEKFTKNEIIDRYFKEKDFKSKIKSYNIKIREISKPSDILDQICSNFIKKEKQKEIDNTYYIDFIPLNLLFFQSEVSDECYDYFEPEIRNTKISHKINIEKLTKYILSLNLNVKYEAPNWLIIENKVFGTFSLYLKNGNIYYYPKKCKNCKESKCLKRKKAPFFICIEAGESNGWTNIKGFEKIELLILSKIFALKEGNEDNLPKSVLNQIININKCDKETNEK